MTVQQIIIVSPEDIAALTLTCKNCKTQIIVPINADGIPERCPTCKKDFDKATQKLFSAFDDFMKSVANSESIIHFQISGVLTSGHASNT